MSSAHEGWYVDPSTGTNLRFWNGSTWTDEVAPLPDGAAHASQMGLTFDSAEPDSAATESPASDTDAEQPAPALDADLEHTRLTRRELRARRGTDPELDDTPRHLSPVAPPAAPPAAAPPPAGDAGPPEEELEIPPAEPTAAEGDAVDATQRRIRVVRLSVLLGILAVVSSVAVLTGGTL